MRKRPRYLEDGESMALMAWASVTPYRGGRVSDYLIHIPNGGKRNAREAGRLKRMGVRAGVPDYFLHVVKVPRPGIVYGGFLIELKADEDSRISENQVEQLKHFQRCGYETARADGWVEAARMICQYLDIPTSGLPCAQSK